MSTDLAPITLDESKRLIALEEVVKAGLSSFIEVGNALSEIREARLYKADYSTFEGYCSAKWGMKRDYADRLIGASAVVATLTPIGVTPATESQARPLTQLDTPEEQREAWQAAVETSGGQPTAKEVQAAVDVVKAKSEQDAPLPPYKPANGLQYATLAIAQLEKISAKDTQRAEAFERVSAWLNKHK